VILVPALEAAKVMRHSSKLRTELEQRMRNQPRMRRSNLCFNCRVTKFTHHLKPGDYASYSLVYCSANPLAEDLTDPEKSNRSRQNGKWPN
jgi:hypothetical protein